MKGQVQSKEMLNSSILTWHRNVVSDGMTLIKDRRVLMTSCSKIDNLWSLTYKWESKLSETLSIPIPNLRFVLQCHPCAIVVRIWEDYSLEFRQYYSYYYKISISSTCHKQCQGHHNHSTSQACVDVVHQRHRTHRNITHLLVYHPIWQSSPAQWKHTIIMPWHDKTDVVNQDWVIAMLTLT